MNFAALIPFIFLLIAFVGFQLPLTLSSFIALCTGSLLAQGFFSMTGAGWTNVLIHTGELSIEIGMILLGAFFFLEVANATGTLTSLASLIRQISPNRIVQGILVTFPLELMVEGSSGFGTPLLIITPILITLGFDLGICIVLPFLTCVVAIPFGALGTPIRLGFPPGSIESVWVLKPLLPFLFLGPLASAFLISKKIRIPELIWIVSLSLVYGVTALFFAKSGPEFAALAPAFLTFIFGLTSAHIFFGDPICPTAYEWRGLIIYGLLLLSMWLGKQVFMDQLIPSTHIRIFNPGLIFILFGLIMLAFRRSGRKSKIVKTTFHMAKRTLIVFFCMAMTVQELRESGALLTFSHSIPNFLLGDASPVLGWLGCILVGSSTVTNLLFAKVVGASHYAGLAAGSAIGVQIAFQSIAAMRSVSQNQLCEKEILARIAPISIVYVVIATVCYAMIG